MAQVPTWSKFTAVNLANYSKIFFLRYISYGVKYTSVINPNLKYRNVSAVLKKSNQIWQMLTIPIVLPLVSPATHDRWMLRAGLFCHWSVVNHSHWRSWWGMHEAEQGIIRCQGYWSHSPCPLRASGTMPTLWSATGCDISSHFHRLWVGNYPNATWEFLGVISSWLCTIGAWLSKNDRSYLKVSCGPFLT